MFINSKNNTYRPDANYLPNKTADFMEQDITYLEFNAALNSLKGNIPGNDQINYTMIKHIGKPVKIRLINLFNSILSYFIAQAFKRSTVVSIYKPGKNKTTIESYRPISLTPCIA